MGMLRVAVVNATPVFMLATEQTQKIATAVALDAMLIKVVMIQAVSVMKQTNPIKRLTMSPARASIKLVTSKSTFSVKPA